MAEKIKIFKSSAPTNGEPEYSCYKLTQAYAWISKQDNDATFDIVLPTEISMISKVTVQSVKEELSKTS